MATFDHAVDHSADNDHQPMPPLAPIAPDQRLGWQDAGIQHLRAGRLRSARARRALLDIRDRLAGFGVRATSALLPVSWRLQITSTVAAEVTATNRETAQTVLERFLRDPATRVVLAVPDRGPTGWRDLGRVPVDRIDDIAAMPDVINPADNGDTSVWAVNARVTAHLTVAAPDAACIDGYTYSDIEPSTTPAPIDRLIAVHTGVRRIPVRRGRHR